MKYSFLICLVASSAFAVLPTISCRVNQDRAFTFEEGIDEYHVEFKERNAPKSFINRFLDQVDHGIYTVVAQIPKVVRYGMVVQPSCLFSVENPLLFACGRDQTKESLKISHLETGSQTELKLATFNIASQIVRSESLDTNGKINSEGVFKIAIRYYSQEKSSVSESLEFPLAYCKVGELDSSPSR